MILPSVANEELGSVLGELFAQPFQGNLPRRLALAERGLTLLDAEAHPEICAELEREVANDLIEMSTGQRRDDLERAIAALHRALDFYTRDHHPLRWANCHVSLAVAFFRRVAGSRAGNLERAIEHGRLALGLLTPEERPEEWAMAKISLGLAYRHRVQGDRSENLELAIARFLDVTQRLSPPQVPAQIANAFSNLGNAYQRRLRDTHERNLEKAITAYRACLALRSRHNAPLPWAIAQKNLGVALHKRVRGDHKENLERSREALGAAIEVFDAHGEQSEAAGARRNLAEVYRQRSVGRRKDNLDRAVALCQEAVSLSSPIHSPTIWAGAQEVLGLLHRERDGDWRAAATALEAALTVYRPDAFPANCRLTAGFLASTYFAAGRWQQTAAACQLGIEATDRLYQAAVLESSRQAELVEAGNLYHMAAYALARCGRLREAALTLEQGRARGLRDALEQERDDLARVRQLDRDLWERYEQARDRLRQLLAQDRSTRMEEQNWQQLAAEAGTVRRELEALLTRIRRLPGCGDFLRAPTWVDLEAAVRTDAPVVYLVTTGAGSLALILNRVTDPTPNVSAEVLFLDAFAAPELETCTQALLTAQRASSPARELEHALRLLGDKLMGPLAAALRGRGAARATLIAGGTLGLLPLHGAIYRHDGEEIPCLAELELAYAPSARALEASLAGLAARPADPIGLAGIADPPAPAPPLRYARFELEDIAALFPPSALPMLHAQRATKITLGAAAAAMPYVHLACHGELRSQTPLDSFLQLADGPLTLRDVLDDPPFPAARLLVLSACQTGLTEWSRLPDEAIGLPAGFLHAGVPGVVATLWPVDDLSTALLMGRFYRYHLRGDAESGTAPMPPAAALQRAQLWLRDLTVGDLIDTLRNRRTTSGTTSPTAHHRMAPRILARLRPLGRAAQPFASAYHWAPFVLVGT